MSERELFIAALQKENLAERQAYLDAACVDRPELREQVQGLLSLYEDAGSFLQKPATAGDATCAFVPTTATHACEETPGTLIGPYKLLQQIGEGGMGTVFMAEQTEPVKRKVALKLIKAGMDSRQVIARFEAERQALAMMDHVNIARVLDAGATEAGRPYFVMELVHGVPITKYCDDHHLTPRERLELFVPVCQAIQHAHQKGIIHRDIKPSNVMVTLYDGKPVPKVIDFGVAKATEQKLTERTLFTQFGTMIGTLEYMSPEQAEMSALGVDTRSDIYSLGVLLYELLTGSTPLTHKRMKEAAYGEILRMIKEEEPPKPSTRLSDSGEALASISAQRHTEPAKLSKLMRGELDWVVMKCLEKDRNRRYETANAFAGDVQRYLADEPVEACPPSARYRLRKFARRNKGPVLTASLVMLALVGGIVGTTVGLVRAEQARQAEAERAEGERRAKDTAEKRLTQIEKGIDILGLIFENLDPRSEEKDGRPLRAILGDRLDQAAAALEGDAVGDPLVVARLQDRLGLTYLGLGHAVKAESLFAKAVATRQAELGADDPLTLVSRNNLALADMAAGKRNQALPLFKQVWDAQVKQLGTDHLDTLTTRHNLAVAYGLTGKAAEAIPLLEQVRDMRVNLLGPKHADTLDTLSQLGTAYLTVGRKTEAIELLKQVRDAQVEKFGAEHFLAVEALNSLGFAYQAAMKMTEATDLFEQARDAIVPKLGNDHPLTLTILHNLAWMYRARGKIAKAIDLGEQVRAKREMYLGAYHPATLLALYNLALAYEADRKPEQALPLFQQAAVGIEKLEFAHFYAAQIVHELYQCHEHLKQYEEAEVWRRKWLAVVKEKAGPESEAYAVALQGLGSNLLQQKKYADAEPMLVQGYEGMKKLIKEPAPTHHGFSTKDRLTEALERIVQLYDDWDKPEKGAEWRKKMKDQKERKK